MCYKLNRMKKKSKHICKQTRRNIEVGKNRSTLIQGHRSLHEICMINNLGSILSWRYGKLICSKSVWGICHHVAGSPFGSFRTLHVSAAVAPPEASSACDSLSWHQTTQRYSVQRSSLSLHFPVKYRNLILYTDHLYTTQAPHVLIEIEEQEM